MRVAPPPFASGTSTGGGSGGGLGSAFAASNGAPLPGRPLWLPLQISVVQSIGLPASSSMARTFTTIDGLIGSWPNSSSRRQRTRTGRPGSRMAITAASAAASSAPLWP